MRRTIESVQKEIRALERLLEIKLQASDDVFVERTLFPDVENIHRKLAQLRVLHRELVLEKERLDREKRLNSLMENSLDFSILDKYKRYSKKRSRRVVRTNNDGTTTVVNDSVSSSGEPPGFMIKFRLSTAYEAIRKQEREAARPPLKLRPTATRQTLQVYFDHRERRWKIKDRTQSKTDPPPPEGLSPLKKLGQPDRTKAATATPRERVYIRTFKSLEDSTSRRPSRGDGPRISVTSQASRVTKVTPERRSSSAPVRRKSSNKEPGTPPPTPLALHQEGTSRQEDQEVRAQNSATIEELFGPLNTNIGLSNHLGPKTQGLLSNHLGPEPQGLLLPTRAPTPPTVASPEDSTRSDSRTSVYSLDSVLDQSSLQSTREATPLPSLKTKGKGETSVTLPEVRKLGSQLQLPKKQLDSKKGMQAGKTANNPATEASHLAKEGDPEKPTGEAEGGEPETQEEEYLPSCRYVYCLSNCRAVVRPTTLKKIRGHGEIVGTINVYDDHELSSQFCQNEGDINCPYCVVGPRRRIFRWLESLETGVTTGIYGGRHLRKKGPTKKPKKKRDSWATPLAPIAEA